MLKITRREVIAGPLATLVVSPAWPQIALPRDADVVIVGAGAAGIAAARRIKAAGRSVVVVEAASEIGGRCQTDTTTFGVPFDRGARFLYDPDGNPIVKLARDAGFDLAPAPIGARLRIGRRNARPGETEQFLATQVKAQRAIEELARGRTDTSCAAALNDTGEWRGATEFTLATMVAGKDAKSLSAADRARLPSRAIALVAKQGLGALLVRLADGVTILRNTPATRIVWAGRDVGVETANGRIAARAIVVTVSTNVLASGTLRFQPDIPRKQYEAAALLSLGHLERIALLMNGNPLGLSRDDSVIEQSADPRTAWLLANIGGSTLCTLDIGGAFAQDLAQRGPSAMTAFATEWLAKLSGGDVAKGIKASAATRWATAPTTMGAVSAAPPGAAGARRVLAEPFGMVVLAGEATDDGDWGTLKGAWQSGERAADWALKRLGPARGERRR